MRPDSVQSARRPLVQPLEARRLLTIGVVGTAAADVIRVTDDGASVLIIINGIESRFGPDAAGIVVNAGDGNDTIYLDDASNVPVRLDGGANDDRFEVGSGDVRSARLTTVDVAGGAGNDSLILNDSIAPTGNLAVSIDNPIDTYLAIVAAPGTLIQSDASNNASAVEVVIYNGTPQGDVVNVAGTNALSILILNGANGDDSMNVGNDIDSKLRGPVTLNGETGANVLSIDDSADSFADTYFLTGTATLGTVRKNSGGSAASFTGFGNVSLFAGAGGAVANNQIFRVDAFPTAISTTIFAGSGDDTLVLGDGIKNLDTFQSNILFNGGDGPLDAIVYNDIIGTDASSYDVNATNVTNTGTATLNFLQTEQLTLTANGAANDLRINSTTSEFSPTINGGAGNDTIHIGNSDFDATILNGASILGGAGTDTLLVEDQADDAGNDAYTFNSGNMTKGDFVTFWSTASADRVESISLLASANNDAIRVNSATPAIKLNIDAGPGNDSFLIASTTEGTTAATAVTIVSGVGNDSLDVNSDATGTDALVAFSSAAESFQDFRVRAGGRATIASGPAGVLSIRGVFTLGGRIDVADATMIVTSNVAVIDAFATAGYAGGTWTGGAAAAAIVSGTAAASAVNDAVGVVSATDLALPTYGGVPTTASDVIVRYTIAGDANLDRFVGFADLTALAQAYGLTGQTWAQGDFTYDIDGSVDFNDLVVLAQNYELSVPIARAKNISPG